MFAAATESLSARRLRRVSSWFKSINGVSSGSFANSRISFSSGSLQVLKKDLGSDGAPMLEQLLIQHAALCWLRLTLAELAYSNVVKGSITLTLGLVYGKAVNDGSKAIYAGL